MSDQCECGAEITFRRHERTGKPAPLETAPHPNGNILILPGGEYRVLNAAERLTTDAPLYRNHFADCPVRRRRP